MNITLILFLIGILGFVLNRKNIILMLISIEIMLLAITFLILVSSLNMDDIIGQTYAIYIIVVAGAESAIGLGILVAFYRLINFPVKNPRSNYSYTPYEVKRFNLLRGSAYAISPFRARTRPWGEGELRIVLALRSRASNLELANEVTQLRNYSSVLQSSRKIVLCEARPSFISGFSDAEGSFVVTILKNPRYKIG